ncbi:hypothetical protein GA003_09765 [Opitutia bacterium ISCC 52]|nr:hypothetical protein GA003_09765 [Opitutae bacterium ISCC 52]
MNHPASSSAPRPWLIRISKTFEHFSSEIIADLGATLTKRLGDEYYLIQSPGFNRSSDAARYIRWNLPMDHTWPCNPEKMEGFIEKAAQTLLKKFSEQDPQGIFMGRLDVSSPRRYYKSLATNLRGRTIPLFTQAGGHLKDVEGQEPTKESLFCLLGREGLFCGIQSPAAANGFYPGGTKFISQKAPHTISRAGAKIAEALHYLKLHRTLPNPGSHWLELGACPGGMTSELLERNYQVTGVDRASLDVRLKNRKGLHFSKADVTRFNPPAKAKYDAILCDMNGEVEISLGQVIRLSQYLRAGGLVVFTLKTPGTTAYQEMNTLFHTAVGAAKDSELALLASTHLTYNRHEFTLFFERKG